MRRTLISLCTALTLALTGAVAAGPAQAAARAPSPGTPTPVTAANLVTPLSVAAGRGSSVLFTQNFAGLLDRTDANGNVSTVYRTSTPGAEVGAVSYRYGVTVFAENTGAGSENPAITTGLIKAILPGGRVVTLADVATHEEQTNPDGNVRYGFRDLPASCLAQVPAEVPASYTGHVDSHAYATEPTLNGVYVADAGGNDIVVVNPWTHSVRTVAVLPPSVTHVTAQAAQATGLPACTVGHDYYFEPVPTDVRKGWDGWLYVSTLPGGPEDPSLGARGAVYRVNPRTGATQLVASGLASPTGLAFSPRGDLYVAELFGNRVSVITRGSHTARPFLSVPLPADVSVKGCTLYVTTNALPGDNTPPAGQVVKVTLAGERRGAVGPNQDAD
ncbi:ScyD/ScyE family protein [Tersicoccus sp. MR15.9]|uniref:ScyD/ScyE family protein n=1 Tax=Tersicoccus mangrovi TaxID=3121635 RepID=UPI002FE5106E